MSARVRIRSVLICVRLLLVSPQGDKPRLDLCTAMKSLRMISSSSPFAHRIIAFFSNLGVYWSYSPRSLDREL